MQFIGHSIYQESSTYAKDLLLIISTAIAIARNINISDIAMNPYYIYNQTLRV